jgi:hypothetical protein
MADPFGVYTYNAMQVQAQKRISAGLTLLANYTWSKSITNADSEYPAQANWNGNGNGGALNTYNLKVEKGLSQYDIPQRLILSYTYQLPFGKGKQFANQGGVVNALVGDWQFAGVQTYESGTPLAVNEGNWNSGIFAGNLGASARPNYVSGQAMNGFHGSGWVGGQSRRLNPAAFTLAPSYSFGDASSELSSSTRSTGLGNIQASTRRFRTTTWVMVLAKPIASRTVREAFKVIFEYRSRTQQFSRASAPRSGRWSSTNVPHSIIETSSARARDCQRVSFAVGGRCAREQLQSSGTLPRGTR